jgi:hypothetical protein
LQSVGRLARAGSGFTDIIGNFGHQLIAGDAKGARQIEVSVDSGLEAAGQQFSRFGQIGNIEEGLVNRELFDQGGQLVEASHYLLRGSRVGVKVRGHDDQVGAEFDGSGHGHGRANAEAAGGVGTGSHNPPRFGPAAYSEDLAAQARVALFFDGTEKGIQVKVQDFAGHGFSPTIILNLSYGLVNRRSRPPGTASLCAELKD